MNTNSKQSTEKIYSGAVCRIIGVLFGLLAFIWLPTTEVDAQEGFTVITGLVRSELNQLPLAGVRVAVLGKHAGTGNSIVETAFNGEYIVIALTTDSSGDPIPFPIEITFTKEGFKPTTVILQESERQNGVITRDVLMRDDSLRLISPPNDKQSNPVTVFRWTRSGNPAVSSYRLEIDNDRDFKDSELELRIIAPQVAVDLRADLVDGVTHYWRVIALDDSGKPVEQSQEVFSFTFFLDGRGFTVISGLVKSDLNLAELGAARVEVSSQQHFANTLDSIVYTVINEEYIVIALTRLDFDSPIGFPIKIKSTKEGFHTIEIDLAESEVKDGAITRNLPMKPMDSDEDGIPDIVENASPCLDANDADTDDDGIDDGDEDTNKDGDRDPGETDPCAAETDPRQPESRASPWIPLLLLGD